MRVHGGSAQIVDNYDLFYEGDLEPHLGKTIQILIFKTTDFIVYLDEDLFVEWAFTPSYDADWSDLGHVLNRVSQVQAFPLSHLSIEQLTTFRQLVGEAVARLLSDRDPESANEALDNATKWVEGRNKEVARWWYLSASSLAAAVMAVMAVALWTTRNAVVSTVGVGAFETAMGATAGGVGAFLFVLWRSKDFPFDPSAARRIHWLEGISRVLAGGAGAALVALAIRSEVILGGVLGASGHRLALLLALCMSSGVSERFVPSLVERVEASAWKGSKSHPAQRAAAEHTRRKGTH